MKTPYDYQPPAIELCKSTNALVMDDRGLGKTFVAVTAIHDIAVGFPKLIICTKLSKTQWKQEILDEYPDDEVIVLDEVQPNIKFQRDCWIIIHYWVAYSFAKYLSNTFYGAICIDECHNIKNRDTHLANAVKSFNSMRKIALTGTPIEHGPRDFFSILQWLQPKRYTSLWTFVKQHCELKKRWTPNGFRKYPTGKCLDPEALAKELSPFSIRRTKEQVAPWLPPKRIFRIPVEMNPVQKQLYNFVDSIDDIEAYDGDGIYYYIPNQMSKLTKLHQIASNPMIIDRHGGSAKIDWVSQYLSDNPSTRSIIATRYRSNARQIAHAINAALVLGGNDSYSGLDDFKEGKINHIVGTIGALAESHNLGMADCIICVDQDYYSIMMDQIVDRHHRANTTTQKDVILLYTPGTVDDLVLKSLDSKWDENELIYSFMNRNR